MKSETFEQVVYWQNKTFGELPAGPKIEHLKDEVKELAESIEFEDSGKVHELADCFILLFGIAHSLGMNLNDIEAAVLEKHEINKARQWAAPDEKGVIKHIK